MLTELRIENLGIIEEVHLLTGPGLTAISGETGAGKTLVTGALALLGGERADATAVRDGATKAHVDGRLATASELSARGVELLDLHAQHAYQALLAAAAQRRLLDLFAGEPA